MDLELARPLPRGPLVEQAVDLELQGDREMAAGGRFARELGVADHVTGAVRVIDQEVRLADELAGLAVERYLGTKQGLVDRGDAFANRGEGAALALLRVAREAREVEDAGQRCQMSLLVPQAEIPEEPVEGAVGRALRFASGAQRDPARAPGRVVVVVDVGCLDEHGPPYGADS
jgi:hypothetical protein